MAAEFEIEVKNSITALQAVVEKLAASNEKVNNSLRKTQEELRKVTAGHQQAAGAATQHNSAIQNNERSITGFGKATGFAGGAMGNMVKQSLEMVKFNPIALAAGVAIGGLITVVGDLIEKEKQATAAAKEMADAIEAAPDSVAKSGRDAVANVDVAARRKQQFARLMGDDATDSERAAAKSAAHGTGISEQEALKNLMDARNSGGTSAFSGKSAPRSQQQLVQIAAGQSDVDPEKFNDDFRRYAGSADQAVNSAAETMQADSRAAALEQAGQAERVAAGTATTGDRFQVAMRSPEEVKVMAALNETLKSLIDEQKAKLAAGALQATANRLQDKITAQETRIIQHQTSVYAAVSR